MQVRTLKAIVYHNYINLNDQLKHKKNFKLIGVLHW